MRVQAMLRKIKLLRAAATAYCQHLKTAGPAYIKRVSKAPSLSVGSALLKAEQQQRRRFFALSQDYVEWKMYMRTGELPERVFSKGLGVKDDEQPPALLVHLPAEQHLRVVAALTAEREYYRLKLRRPATTKS